MESLRHLLPSAGALIVFEAAGRLLSFTAAGRELGMSQAAVSYAIRGLEGHLNVPLFRREHRKINLTEAGLRFFADVTLGLSYIRRSTEDLLTLANDTYVTLTGSTAFASFWMMPRMQKFRTDFPDIELRIQTSDRDIDLVSEGIPLGIRNGNPSDWPEYNYTLLAKEEVFVIASPAYKLVHGIPENVEELATRALIHLEEPVRKTTNWTDWFASANITPIKNTRGLLLNDYALVIQAVIEGQGIALGWQHLTHHLLKSKSLIRVTDHMLNTGNGVYIIWPKDRILSVNARLTRDWLVKHC